MKTKLKLYQLLSLTLLLVILNSVNADNTQSQSSTSANLSLNQFGPKLTVTDIKVDNNLPTEGDIVSVIIVVQNQDEFAYESIRVELTLVPMSDEGPNEDAEDVELEGFNIGVINSSESVNLQTEFVAIAGQYQLVGIIVYQNQEIPSSMNSVNLQILQPLQGDNLTLIFALAFIVIFILGFVMLQPTYDKLFRVRKNGKPSIWKYP